MIASLLLLHAYFSNLSFSFRATSDCTDDPNAKSQKAPVCDLKIDLVKLLSACHLSPTCVRSTHLLAFYFLPAEAREKRKGKANLARRTKGTSNESLGICVEVIR